MVCVMICGALSCSSGNKEGFPNEAALIDPHQPLSLPRCCAAARILEKVPELKANFSRVNAAVSQAKKDKVARFLPNPEANWGPKAKHGRTWEVGGNGGAGAAAAAAAGAEEAAEDAVPAAEAAPAGEAAPAEEATAAAGEGDAMEQQ